jgi:hypothetical protein
MKMAHEKIEAAILFVTIFVIVGGVSWALVNAQQIPNQPDQTQTMLKLMIHEQICDAPKACVEGNHPETAQFMDIISRTGRRQDTNLLGAETYTYHSQGWNVTMQYPVVLDPIYSVTAKYTSPVSQITPEQIIVYWQGTLQNGTITETGYVFNP